MPHMIPNAVSSDTRSRAEKKLFMKMIEMEDTDDWYVLHSVGIARHPTQSQGEADFVVVIPGSGVFVLEVKGGDISFDGTHWYSEDYYGKKHRIHDPIAEANNACHAFRRFLSENAGWTGQLLFGFGVVFLDTEVHGKVVFPDLNDAQICDLSDLADIRGYLLGLASHWKYAFSRTGFSPLWPDAAQCAEIARILRPTFETSVSVSAEIRNLEQDIVRLTERQITVFEGLTENDRVLVKGGVGTGKTLLALRYAGGMADKGKNVGLFCLSPNLAEFFRWAAEEIEKYIAGGTLPEPGSRRIFADSFPEYMKRTGLPDHPDRDHRPFDVLVVDEAQDLITPEYTKALDRTVKNGLKDGVWCMFLDSDPDFLRRLHRTEAGSEEQLKKYGTCFTRFTLKENCRNSQAIADTVDELFGMNDQPAAREEYGQEVQFVKYGTMDQQEKAVRKQLRDLLEAGVRAEDIVILSPRPYGESVAARLENICCSWKEAREKGSVLFSTIADFRSMESAVVIVTDCGKRSLSTDAHEMYIAMTRARGMLIVNLDSEAGEYLDRNRGKGFLQRYGEPDGGLLNERNDRIS